MESERSSRIIATIGTAMVAALIVLWLMLGRLATQPVYPPPPPQADITLADEEFVELISPESISAPGEDNAATYMDEPQTNESQPTPAAGTDIEDAGPKGEVTPVVASNQPSDVKVTKDKTPNPAAVEDKKKKEEEEIRRNASNEVANAFKNSAGKHNSATSEADKGNNGQPTANRNSQGTTGTGTGVVGGGWIIPKYAPVRSEVTGSIKMMVKIDNTGHVVSVTFTGGEPPAATNAAVQAAVEREIRAHKFSRSDYSDAEGATAQITYTFR